MKTYYVATLSSYVLVEAENEAQARELGSNALREQFGASVPFRVRVVREASAEEIALCYLHRQSEEAEADDEQHS